jgi:phosphonate transport system substrate-binding protein
VVVGCVLALAIPGMARARESAAAMPSHVTLGFSRQIFVDVESAEAQSILRVLASEITKRDFPGSTSESVILGSDGDLQRALVEKRIDMAGMTCDEYLRLRGRVPMEPAFTTTNGRDPYHQVVLLVRRDAGIRNLAGLSGKRLTLSADQAKSIHLTWLQTLLMREGLPGDETYFSAVREARRPSEAILPVFFRQADACLTSQQAFDIVRELNPQVGTELVVLARSADITSGVLVFRPDFDPAAKELIAKFLDGLEKVPQGLQILRLFRMNRLMRWRPEFVESVETLIREHERLKSGAATRTRK